MSELLLAHPDWTASILRPEQPDLSRSEHSLRREVNRFLHPLLKNEDYHGALGQLRDFKQRDMVRITARDLARLGQTMSITKEISCLADLCLETVYQICRQRLTHRWGTPRHKLPEGDWVQTPFCILGLGKLGGTELNYSSDVDVIFLYEEEGQVFRDKAKGRHYSEDRISNHQFFVRLAESIVTEISRATDQGSLFRIDLRLRPEGDSGPLVRSLESYENYYSQWGQTWERLMLIKARPVAGNRALGGEFLEMIQPFRYPRMIGENMLSEIAALKQRINREVVKVDELHRNVKLGQGGIREIEFTAQALQVLYGGKIPFIQNGETLAALTKLAQYHVMEQEQAEALRQAYVFFRDVEHRLQMEMVLGGPSMS